MTQVASSAKLSKASRLLRKAAFPLYSCAIALIVLELVLRVTHFMGANVLVTERDPYIGYSYVPEQEYVFTKEDDHPIFGHFNSEGWRDVEWTLKKPEGEYRVAVLGDSFVESFQVEEDRNFVNCCEKRLSKQLGRRVEFMNFGRSGFTQSEEYLVLKRSAAKFHPDMAVLFLFPENDITDISPATAPVKLRPFYSLDTKGRLVLDTSFRQLHEYKGDPLIYYMKRHSVLFNFVEQKRSDMKAEAGRRKWRGIPDGITRTHGLEGYITLCTKHPDPQYIKNYRINKALIRAMADFCHQRGIRFMLVCLDIEAYDPAMEQTWKRVDPTFNVNFYEDDLREFAESLGIDYLGLQRPFRRSYETQKVRLHWGKWGHWNYKGHELVTDLLSQKLASIIPAATHKEAGAR